MSEELQQKLRDQLWEVANKLRGNMSASDFPLGFIFQYLSEKIEAYANVIVKTCFDSLFAIGQKRARCSLRRYATILTHTTC